MLNFLVPPFIKKLDKHFLLNYPILWISKIHYVLYYAVIMWLISALLGYLVPVNLVQTQDIALWYVLFSVLAIILFCIWIYKNAIFNVEKKFGNRRWTDEYKLFLLYFACIFIFFSFAYPFAITYNSKIAHTVTDEEFIADINVLNRAEPFIPNELYSYETYFDSVQGKTFFNINKCRSFGRFTPDELKDNLGPGYSFKVQRPSGVKSDARLKEDYLHDKLSDEAILQALSDRNRVVEKYGLGGASPAEILKTYKFLCKQLQEINYQNNVSLPDDYQVRMVFDHIAEAKFKTLFLFREDFLFGTFYFIFYLVLFFLLFRNTQWQHFLITCIALIVLPILLFIIGQILPYSLFDSGRQSVFDTGVMLVFLLGLFFTIRFMIMGKSFSAFNNISMQLFYILFPVMSMYTVYYLKQHTGIFHHASDYNVYNSYDTEPCTSSLPVSAYSAEYFYDRFTADYWARQYDLWFMGLQLTGIIGFMTVVMPLMKEVFVKQLALPRRK